MEDMEVELLEGLGTVLVGELAVGGLAVYGLVGVDCVVEAEVEFSGTCP